MREWQSLSHVKWYCRYHVVFVPKYRKRAIFGHLRKGIGGILRQLCQQEGVELVEGHARKNGRNNSHSGDLSPLHLTNRGFSPFHPLEAPSGGLHHTAGSAGGT